MMEEGETYNNMEVVVMEMEEVETCSNMNQH